MENYTKQGFSRILTETYGAIESYQDAYDIFFDGCGILTVDLQQRSLNIWSGNSGDGGFLVCCGDYTEIERKIRTFIEFLEID